MLARGRGHSVRSTWVVAGERDQRPAKEATAEYMTTVSWTATWVSRLARENQQVKLTEIPPNARGGHCEI